MNRHGMVAITAKVAVAVPVNSPGVRLGPSVALQWGLHLCAGRWFTIIFIDPQGAETLR